MNKTIVIVESPGKIKKIQNILGNKYIVIASKGHIIDLDKKDMGIDIENNFTPKYIICKNKISTVEYIKKLYNKYKNIIIASDGDREGEMIGWSIEYILNKRDIPRITFNSITKREILKAIKNPTKINNNIVNAQKTRRMLDRIIGFKLSELLMCNNIGRSAGRVKSVVVKLIIQREKEINEYMKKIENQQQNDISSYKITSKIHKSNIDLCLYKCDIHKKKFEDKYILYDVPNKQICKNIMKYIIKDGFNNNKQSFKIIDIIKQQKSLYPKLPYTTSTLQQDAYNKLKLNSKNVMKIAQKLYEKGYITYMRTDSINLSDEIINDIKKYIINKYGNEYYKYRKFNNNSVVNGGQAHEAIRPTNIYIENINDKDLDNKSKLLYNMIWKNTISSCMSECKYNVYNYIITTYNNDDMCLTVGNCTSTAAGNLPNIKKRNTDIYTTDNTISYINANLYNKYVFIGKQNILIFDGFKKIYGISNYDNNTSFNINDDIKLEYIKGIQVFRSPPTRYNEATLISKLDPKNLNIGRPATYSIIIDDIKKYNYIQTKNIDGINTKNNVLLYTYNNDNNHSSDIVDSYNDIIIGKEYDKLVPTELAIKINDYLNINFPDIMDYRFTANMEKNIDKVSLGKQIYHQVLSDFYYPFIKKYNILKCSLQPRVYNKIKYPYQRSGGYKLLGRHPKTHQNIYIGNNKYGKFIALQYDSNKYKFFNIKKSFNPCLQQAIDILNYPINIGNYKNHNIYIKYGKYGRYISYNKININIDNKKFDNIDLNQAIKLIESNK